MKHTIRLHSFLAIAGSSLLTVSHAPAGTYAWNYDGTTAGSLLWDTLGSWTTSELVVPNNAGDVVTFTNNITAARTITISTATTRTVGSMTIGDSDNTHGFTISDAGTGVLVFDKGLSAAILTENGSVNDNITAAVSLNSNLDITANGSLTFNAGNNLFTANSKTITKLGAGSLTFSNNNGTSITSTATFDVQAGTLVNNNSAAWGSAAIILDGGNLDATSTQNGVTAAGANIHTWKQNWTWAGTASAFGLGTGAVTLGAPTIQLTVTQNLLNVGGVIGDAGNARGLTKAGNGALVLAAANTYTGTTTVSGGVLRLANNTSIAGGIGASGGLSALTLNGGVVELAASNFSRGFGTGASQFQVTGGTSGFSSYGSAHSVTVNDNAGQEVQWGSTHFSPTTLVLNASTANAGLEFRNGLDLNGADRTINVNANTAVISGNIRTTAGTAGLVKGGTGTLVLSGTNTYNGSTTVNAGVLSVGSAANLPGYASSGNIVINGGTLRVAVGGSGWTTGQVDTLLSNATKTSGALGLDTSSGNLTQWTTFTTNLGSLGLEKSGSNTLTLNQVNSYTGATTLSGGTLRIQNSSGLTQTLSGGLNIAGPDVTIHSDYTGGTLSTAFGALTRTAGSTVNFSVTGGTNGTTNTINTTGAAGFINGGTFFNGTDFAWRDSTGFVRAPIYTGGTPDSGTSAANALTASTHALLSADKSIAMASGVNLTLSSLKITGGADLTYTTSTNSRLLTRAIVASGGDSVLNFNGGLLSSGDAALDLVIRVDGSTDVLTTPGLVATGSLVKSGAGKLVVTGSINTLPTAFVNGGILEVQNDFAPTNVDIATGATLIYNRASGTQSFGGQIITGTISGGGNLVKNGGATLTISSPTAFTGTTTISGGVLSLGNAYALAGSTLDTSASIAGTSSVGLRITSGISSLTLGGLSGNKNFAASGGVISTSSSNYGNITALTLNPGAGISNDYSGVIANGASDMTLTKTGQGTQILSGTNTYTGATTIEAGTLVMGDAAADAFATSGVTVNSGGTLGGSGTIAGTVTVKSGGTHNAGNSPGIQTITGNVSYESGSIFAWDLAANLDGDTGDGGDTGTRGTQYDGVTVTGGDLTVQSGAIFRVIQNTALDFTNAFWDTNQTWSDIFSVSGTLTGWSAATSVAVYNTSNVLQDVSAYGSFSITGGTLNWAPVPEPTSALAGLLLGAGLLRRRRR